MTIPDEVISPRFLRLNTVFKICRSAYVGSGVIKPLYVLDFVLENRSILTLAIIYRCPAGEDPIQSGRNIRSLLLWPRESSDGAYMQHRGGLYDPFLEKFLK